MTTRVRPLAAFVVAFLTAAVVQGQGERPIPTKPVVIAVGSAAGAPGAEVTVPITLKGVKDAKGVRGASMRLSFDPAVLEFKTVDRGPALAQSMLGKDSDQAADPGKVGIGFVCTFKSPTSKEFSAVEDDGVVLNVVFTVKPDAAVGTKSPLKADNFRVIDTGTPAFELNAAAEAGEVEVRRAGLPFPWWWILVGVGALLLLLILLRLLFGGRRRRRDEEEEPRRRPAPPPTSAVPRFTPEGATTFAHTCVRCGGVIQLPRAMAGHQFQCGSCGTTQTARG